MMRGPQWRCVLLKLHGVTKASRLSSALKLAMVIIAVLTFASSVRAQQALYPQKEGVQQVFNVSDIPKWMSFDMELRGRTEEQTSLGYVSGKDRLYELTRVWGGMKVVPTNWLTLYGQYHGYACAGSSAAGYGGEYARQLRPEARLS
jgi:hypothetical protein